MSDGRCGVGDTERDLESEEQEIAGDETDKESRCTLKTTNASCYEDCWQTREDE